jgi:D-glycero-D-manno-heptose 1,7-bisphosphate phosphatase
MHINVKEKIDRALFLDRDGVINVNHEYVHTVESFEFIDGIFDLARHAISHNYKLVVITNQSGIGRGYYSEAQFHQLTDWMCQHFSKAGAPITKVYFSPYHPTAGQGKYRKDDISRKPQPGMIIQAQKDLSINLKSSVLIGDKQSDVIAGNAANVGKILYFSTNPPMNLNGYRFTQITRLLEALTYLPPNGQ